MTTQQIEARKKAIYGKAVGLNNGKREGCEAFLTEQEKKELAELMFRALIITCLLLGQSHDIYDEETKRWGETGEEYGVSPFGYDRAYKIWLDQKEGCMHERTTIENAA